MFEIDKYFSFQIFFIFLRESLEIVIIISILLTIVKQAVIGVELSNQKGYVNDRLTVEEEAFLDRIGDLDNPESLSTRVSNHQLYQRLKVQIFAGGALGLFCCMVIGVFFIMFFYYVGSDLWSVSEHYYEGVLSILASIIISVMGLFFLRMGRLKETFRIKLASMIYSEHGNVQNMTHKGKVKLSEKYALFILPFVTSLREGLEAVIFVGGIGIDQPLTSIPLSMLLAVASSFMLGNFFFRSSCSFSLNICLIIATCFLYLISAGLFSKGVWQFELQRYIDLCNGQDMSEVGSGPGSYDISNSVWHVNCCNGERDGLWMVFTALLGWTNSATYGSVISYIVYWLVVIGILNLLMLEEQHGYIPIIPIKWQECRIRKRLELAKKAKALKIQQQTPASTDLFEPSGASNESVTSVTPLLFTSENNMN
ncbi:Fth1p Ecym_1183 [Eremothecium cymbalariae DBVPG|uniref:Iron transporter FTH1 n=1 Tax=Eremothecium cymbalariae (strain CBS 270.75 / DBVPG 7215 / KCTC 17166 / NRRL Y-17582) TaxID=931890 RepID=G8JMW9_ERECY|nr:hypothetical protein Ecym_1183 [Eremothecium cymbalariae DBVPG\